MSQAHQYKLSARSEVAPFLPERYKTVLEIGCSNGGFIINLDPSAEIWGVEPNEDAAAQASARGYKVLNGRYDDIAAKCPDHYFDVVICNDVIEHLVDHDKFLAEIKQKISKGGYLVGSIPNVRHFGNLFKLLVKKDWRYETIGVLDRTHLRFFTEKSLQRTFSENGYRIHALKGINSDFAMPKKTRQVLRNALLAIIIALSCGHFRDTKHLQFAFRLTPED
jgi:2-polyprenyl-3-methyl-5-hydroxy-6-metoxy-1,4-benzoquinol methylase